jgi:hypothetical protein
MTSEISSRAACLAELISNPKSFFNCPDLHGGSGLPEAARSRDPGDGRWETGADSGNAESDVTLPLVHQECAQLIDCRRAAGLSFEKLRR